MAAETIPLTGPSHDMFFSQPGSSRVSSRAPSRRQSLSSGRGSGSGSASASRTSLVRRSVDLEANHKDEADEILFKAPDDDDGEHEHAEYNIPLLNPGDREAEEEEELLLFDGPMSATRGTMAAGIANMANSIMGAGIIGLAVFRALPGWYAHCSLPYAIAQSGLVMGIVLLVAIAGLTDWTIRLVVVNAKLSGRDSYFEVMHHCFGPLGSGAVSFFQFAFAFGGMCAFNVIIGDTIPHVVAWVLPFTTHHAWLGFLVDRRFVIVLCTIAVSFPLSLHRDIVKLSKSSSFALVSMAIIVASVVLRGVAVDPSLRGDPLEALSLIRPGVFSAIGVISFAFVCHHNTMFIYRSIQTPTLDRFNAVTHASTGMALAGSLLMAVTGYVVFTDKTEGNILNNFAPDDWVINIARFCFGANMSTTIPLENYVCREVIEDYFFKDRPFSKTRHIVVTSLIVFTAMLVSLVTCDLGVVLEVAGGLSATALAFIFPAAAYYALVRGPWYTRQKLPAVACAGFGLVVLLLSCGLTVAKAWRGEGAAKQCT